MKTAPPSPANRLSRWLTRIQAIGFGFVILALIEFSCRVLGFGHRDVGHDPFVGFSAVEPLFALNPLTNHYDLRPERSMYFISDGFDRFKDPKTFRIFVLGGSTVQGRPYAIQTAFPKWLEINLQLAYPDRKFEAVNCGGISYASYRLLPIMEECLAYEPDLFIVCTGQNEFLEARTYGSLKQIARQLGGPVKFIRNLGSYQALDAFCQHFKQPGIDVKSLRKPTMKMEVDAMLDYRRGLQAYHRDPEWRQGVIAHFEENFHRMLVLSKEAGIPLVILNPPVNLKDTIPFKSEHSAGVSLEKKTAFQEYLDLANDYFQTDVGKAAQYLEWAIELDPNYAEAHYSLGHCYLGLGEFAKAEQSFTNALIEDVCPLRLLPSMRDFVNRFCQQNKIPSIDLQPLLKAFSEEPVIGSAILVDHVHPSVKGHQYIGEKTAELMFDNILDEPPSPNWISRRAEAYKAHLATLDDLYYAKGQLRLANLIAWTKGESDGLPIEMHQPIDLK
jgi:tetratricopeptide (TPR) repeat protein